MKTELATCLALGTLVLQAWGQAPQDSAQDRIDAATQLDATAPAESAQLDASARTAAQPDAARLEDAPSDAAERAADTQREADRQLDQRDLPDEPQPRGDEASRDDAAGSDESTRDRQADSDAQQGRAAEGDTPPRPQITGDLQQRMDRNAPWRMTQYRGEWWYFAPDEQWMYHRNGRWHVYSADTFRRPNWTGRYGEYGQPLSADSGRHIVGYRGYQTMNGDYGQGLQGTGQVYLLRYDANGREFICVNGQPVYFDTQAGQGQRPTPAERGVMSGNEASDQPDDAPSSTRESEPDVASPSDAPPADNPSPDTGRET